MNCQEFWNQLSKPPGGEFGLGAESQAHLRECPLCTAHLARQRELTEGLRCVARDFGGMQAPARVEARLLKAFRAQSGLPARSERRVWLAPLAWAAAITMVLAAGLFLGVRQPVAPVAAPAAIASVESPTTVNGDEAGLEADGFIALPNAETIGPNEAFDLVRVEVPRSAMMEVGIPVSPERASETVEADVILGSDGLVRAVRFME